MANPDEECRQAHQVARHFAYLTYEFEFSLVGSYPLIDLTH
jgi:hypothetical protein